VSAPTVLHPRTSVRWLWVAMAVVLLGVLGYMTFEYGLFSSETLPVLGLTVLVGGGAGLLLASTSPLLVLDDRGFHAPLMRWHETVTWRRVAVIRLGNYPWGPRYFEVLCWRDPADHSRGYGAHLVFPAIILPRKPASVIDEMQRRRSEATVD
jgi:hypothetical protein